MQYLYESPGVQRQREQDWHMTQIRPEPMSHQLSCVLHEHVTYRAMALML